MSEKMDIKSAEHYGQKMQVRAYKLEKTIKRLIAVLDMAEQTLEEFNYSDSAVDAIGDIYIARIDAIEQLKES